MALMADVHSLLALPVRPSDPNPRFGLAKESDRREEERPIEQDVMRLSASVGGLVDVRKPEHIDVRIVVRVLPLGLPRCGEMRPRAKVSEPGGPCSILCR